MNCTEFLDRLDTGAADELDPARAADARCHLDECASCREQAESVRRLLHAASQLPSSVEPPRDLWPEISERIDAGRTPVAFPLVTRRRSVLYLAAAAVLAFAAVTAILSFNRTPERMAGDDGAGRVGPEITAEVVSNPGSDEIYRVRRELQAVLKSRQHEISESTMNTVMINLAVIDDAITRIEKALAEEPGNTELQHLRLAVYQREAKLLRQVARMPADA